MAVVLIVVAIGLSLLAVALQRQWEFSRFNQCKSNLSAIGAELYMHQANDPQGRFCTGAPDRVLDGPLDSVGWVADVVSLSLNSARLKCATNSVEGLATYEDVVKLDGAQTAAKWRSEGYDTNYTASWRLTRAGLRLATNSPPGEFFFAAPPTATHPALDPANCYGPLTIRGVEASHIAASQMAFIADAAPYPKRPGGEAKWALALNGGPAKVVGGRLTPIQPGADLTNQTKADNVGKPGEYLQDTRGWGAPHARGVEKVGIMLMADGSVKEFADVNNDGFLNPGFVLPASLNEQEAAELKYQSSTIELAPAEMYNGVFLEQFGKLGAFES